MNEEIENLFKEYNKTKSLKVRDKIFNLYFDLLTKTCRKFINLTTRSEYVLELGDFVSIGSVGLLKAIEKNKNCRTNFSAFAVLKIRNEIIDTLRKDLGRPSPNLVRVLTALEGVGKSLGDRLSYTDIASKAKLPTKQVKKELKNLTHKKSYAVAKNLGVDVEFFSSSSKDEYEKLVELENLQKLADGFNSLERDAREFLTLYFFKNFTLVKISKLKKYSETEAGRKLEKYLRTLKQKMSEAEELVAINRQITLLETAIDNAILEGASFSQNTGHGSLAKTNHDLEKLQKVLADLRFRKSQITGEEPVAVSLRTFVKEEDY